MKRQDYYSNGKNIVVNGLGEVFVNSSTCNMKIWESNEKRYSNSIGSEIVSVRGMALNDALIYLGFL